MVSASLAVARRLHPDSVRISALSVAIALNLAALLLVLRPMAPQIAEALAPKAPTLVHWIEAQPLPPEPPPIVLPKVQPATPKVTAQPKTIDQPPPVVTAPMTDEGTAPAVENAPLAPIEPPAANTAPVEASLAYRTAPLSYPRDGILRHLEGTVLLRVLVDENGKPIQVEIEKSSGQPILDRSARSQVLDKWLFQPAVVQGQHVKAWARVPVTFNLNQM
ncbi:MAG TPA: energy transducer TonB [Dyella sp.]|uniref:energy transducer TonB n=1 Tax=Dyella sp. TaxID=1869338 RepID=UPI002F9491C3